MLNKMSIKLPPNTSISQTFGNTNGADFVKNVMTAGIYNECIPIRFTDGNSSAGFRHTNTFLQALYRVCQMLEHSRRTHCIETVVAKLHSLNIACAKFD